MTTTIPILLYHSVSTAPPAWIAPFTVTPRTFTRHLDLIAASGRTALTVSQFRDALAGDVPLPPRPLLVTFDDGFADFVEAASELAARKLPSTLYVTTGALRGPSGADPRLALPPAEMLSWSDVRALPGFGVEVGAHTHTHPQLDVLPPGEVDEEIRRSKHQLEDALGGEVRSFAYPHGFHSPRVCRAVRAAGYTSACAVMNALSARNDRLFALARLTVRADTGVDRLAAWLAGDDARVAPSREKAATRAWRFYRRADARWGDLPAVRRLTARLPRP
ncbi:MAG TPA: polysaccharide deacetylase family protein [Actinomycetospora sp.]|jgi:peptidoglycan/xylan/chitin deacetylase (PgdA/CDA1 family)|uniref:polysaccharide deacetylase family protein n=1 Tax=Actinomycetospora sp. TaxID=1872135 RepID=UPI002F3FC2DB